MISFFHNKKHSLRCRYVDILNGILLFSGVHFPLDVDGFVHRIFCKLFLILSFVCKSFKTTLILNYDKYFGRYVASWFAIVHVHFPVLHFFTLFFWHFGFKNWLENNFIKNSWKINRASNLSTSKPIPWVYPLRVCVRNLDLRVQSVL